MNRTRTLIIVGCFMFALAVLAAFELREEVQTSSEGQMVTGALSPATPSDAGATSVAQALSSAEGDGKGANQVPMAAPAESMPSLPAEPLTSAQQASAQQANAEQRELALLPPPMTTPGKNPSSVQERQPGPSPVVNKPEPLSVSHAASAEARSAEARSDVKAAAKPSDVLKAVPAEASPIKEVVKTSPPKEVVKTSPPKEVVKTSPPKEVVKTSPVKEADKAAPVKEAEKTTPAKEADKSASAKEANKPEPKAPKAESETVAKSAGTTPKVLSTAAPEKLEAGEKAIVWTRLEVTPQSVVFRLTGAAALEGKAFVLPNPDRYVVDLQGFWGIALPKVPENTLVKTVREGRQGTNTRLVFDLKKTPAVTQMVRINPETLEIRIR